MQPRRRVRDEKKKKNKIKKIKQNVCVWGWERRLLRVRWVECGSRAGSIVDARRTWRKQRELARHWALCLPNRVCSQPARGTWRLRARSTVNRNLLTHPWVVSPAG